MMAEESVAEEEEEEGNGNFSGKMLRVFGDEDLADDEEPEEEDLLWGT